MGVGPVLPAEWLIQLKLKIEICIDLIQLKVWEHTKTPMKSERWLNYITGYKQWEIGITPANECAHSQYLTPHPPINAKPVFSQFCPATWHLLIIINISSLHCLKYWNIFYFLVYFNTLNIRLSIFYCSFAIVSLFHFHTRKNIFFIQYFSSVQYWFMSSKVIWSLSS